MRTYFRDGRWRTQTMTSVIRERAESRKRRGDRETNRTRYQVQRLLGWVPFVEDLREKHYVGDHWITLEMTGNDGRQRWGIYDANEMRHGHVWGKEAAKAAAMQLATEGRISR